MKICASCNNAQEQMSDRDFTPGMPGVASNVRHGGSFGNVDCPAQSDRLLALPSYRNTSATSHLVRLLASLDFTALWHYSKARGPT